MDAGFSMTPATKYFDWKKRFGKVSEHNRAIARDHWLDESEQKAMPSWCFEFILGKTIE
jgi:hypothetical protein